MSDGDGVALEFVCPTCLRSILGNDLQPIPRCPRCGTRMAPDDATDDDATVSARPPRRQRVLAGKRAKSAVG